MLLKCKFNFPVGMLVDYAGQVTNAVYIQGDQQRHKKKGLKFHKTQHSQQFKPSTPKQPKDQPSKVCSIVNKEKIKDST